MSSAAKAYARAATLTANPVEVKAQLTLKAARKLQAVVTDANVTWEQAAEALEYNEKVWRLFLRESMNQEDQFPPEYCKHIRDVGILALAQTWALLHSPLQLDEYKVLIDINSNFAAGLRQGAAIAAGGQTSSQVPKQVLSHASL